MATRQATSRIIVRTLGFMGGRLDEPAAARRVPRWALPGEVAVLDGGPPRRRTARDWAVDLALFAVAGLWWLWGYQDFVLDPSPEYLALVDEWMIMVDPWLGAAGCLALWWRRRFPLALAIATVAALLVSSTVTGAVLVALFTLAVHRGWLPATLVTAAAVAQGLTFSIMYQPPELSTPVFMAYAVLMFAVPLGWGMVVRLRRQLLVSLRRDAQRERDEHRRRLEEARGTERANIAREMHDVLAHRISLLSVHAGALAYRTAQAERGLARPLSDGEVTQALEVIRANAHDALSELGQVLTMLRAGDSGEADARAAPQPQLADLDRLVDEAAAAGQRVVLERDPALSQPPGPRQQEQRTAYRVVQEGLTNARKHAPHARVTVCLSGSPGQELQVSVANPLPVGVTAVEIPGAGAGLAGLAERVALDGGTLRHGAIDGQFRLTARLPWQP